MGRFAGLLAFLSLMAGCSSVPSEQDLDFVPRAAPVSEADFNEYFARREAACRAALPYDKIELRLRYIGYSSSPAHDWSIAADGQGSFTDFGKAYEAGEDEAEPISFEAYCADQSEIFAIAEALIETSPTERECASFSDHAIRGEIFLTRDGERKTWPFNYSCREPANPGFNGGIRAVDNLVREIALQQQGEGQEPAN